MQVRRSFKNILFGFLSQIISTILGLIITKLFISSFGSNVNGLIASISQIFVYIGLFEAGVGTATLVALYGPVAKGDKQSINEILSATNVYYKRTGKYYFIAVLIFAIVYPLVISTNIDTVTVISIIFLTGIVGVVNFFFQGKFIILLNAEGKNYVITNLGIIINILTSLAKIFLILKGYNVIAVQSTCVIFSLIQIIYINYYIKLKYKWLDLKVKPDYKAISKKGSVFIHQVSALIFFNTDVIILTIFCNLKIVSVYALYALLFGTIGKAINNISDGFSFNLGQTFNVDRQKYIKIHDTYELFFMALVFALYSIAFVFILPFLKLYTTGITDINYIDTYLPILFVGVYLLSICRSTSSQVINFAGNFKETQWRSILESFINLSSSLILVNFFGIYGVLMGTILALLYRTNDFIIYANKHILNRSPMITYRRVIVNLCLFIPVVFVSNLLPIDLHTYARVFIWAAIYCFIVIPLFIIVNLLIERDIFADSIKFIKPYIRKAFKLS